MNDLDHLQCHIMPHVHLITGIQPEVKGTTWKSKSQNTCTYRKSTY